MLFLSSRDREVVQITVHTYTGTQEGHRRAVLPQGLRGPARQAEHHERVPLATRPRRPRHPHRVHRRGPRRARRGGARGVRGRHGLGWGAARPPRHLQGVLAHTGAQPQHREHMLRRRHA
uniref:Uncharacterized protein n=1 Tax=Aegilops tauschii subsp. strangulata TaxID=200361 RepID=A0A453FGY7_AEGTS